MGLDMYLYKSKKGQFKARQNYYDAMNKHWEKWEPILRSLPRKDNGWELDDSKMTDQQKADRDQEAKEREGISVSMNYNEDSQRDNEIHYWRKFNALHGYIVQNFADGVDKCQTIEIKDVDGSYKGGVKDILDALRRTKKKLDAGKKTGLDMMPTAGFFFGSTEIDKWYEEDVAEALEFFNKLYEELEDDDVIYYEASW